MDEPLKRNCLPYCVWFVLDQRLQSPNDEFAEKTIQNQGGCNIYLSSKDCLKSKCSSNKMIISHKLSKFYEVPFTKSTDPSVDIIHFGNIVTNDESKDVSKENVDIVTTKTNKMNRVKPNKSTSKALFIIKSFPKMICPCCTGGDDNLEDQYKIENEMKLKLDDGINITSLQKKSSAIKNSSQRSSSINLNASVLSILHFHSLKTSKKFEYFTKIVKSVMRNSYKNTIGMINSKI